MKPFEYIRPSAVSDAVEAMLSQPSAQVLAGGTNLVDLMKYDVTHPATIIDINDLPLKEIKLLESGALCLGALTTNAQVAYDARIQEQLPLLSSAILAGASAQLRNAATSGGNLLQRTRCYYFYDPSTPCNKRNPGSGCSAIGGLNRIHAILGASDHCIATHPSDMCVALAALDAMVEVTGPEGDRDIPMLEFHRLPGDHPERDNTLQHGEIVTGIRVEPGRFDKYYSYLKLRDRLSYAFALVSVAAALDIEDGKIIDARVALGGVAHKPWRDPLAEAEIAGHAPTRETFAALADRLLAGAKGQGQNDFKIPMAHKAIVRALTQAAEGRPQIQSEKRVR